MNRISLMVLLCSLFLPVVCSGENRIVDIGMAKSYCDDNILAAPEGIWEFPEDETVVLIKASRTEKRSYDIIVLETPDCRLDPGDVIGSLKTVAEKNKYRLKLFAHRKDRLFTDSRDCLATMDNGAETLLIYPKKIRITFRSLGFLPKFWRLISVKVENPLDNLHRGLIKIYPSFDGNQSESDGPRWL